MSDLGWTDNCDGAGVVTGTDGALTGGTCGGTIIRTWTYTDACGNVATTTQTITIDDTTPPTASNPANINITIGPAPAPELNDVTDELDNCTLNPIVQFVSDLSDGNACPEVITRTFSITDDCGNETIVTQLIIIGGGAVPSPTVSANGPICEGQDIIFTIEGIAGAEVTYTIGLGNETTFLTGGSAEVIVPSASVDATIVLSNISEGSCSSILNLTATAVVTTLAVPTFNGLGPYCIGDTPEEMINTSLEGITGLWTPTVVNTTLIGITTYTYEADGGQCATGTSTDVEITVEISPTFIQISPICINAIAPEFLNTSINGINGSWFPAVINTSASGISTYTFTPDPGLCASITIMDIVIDPSPQVTFDQLGAYCQGETPGTFSGNSLEGIIGTWSPSVINTTVSGTSTYTFTIEAGQCATGATMDISTIEPTIPSFTQLAPICMNDVAPALVLTSNNGVTGTWNPSIISTSVPGTSTYTFTPDAVLCASTTTMDITIDPAIQSSFTALGPYCLDDAPDALVTTSPEGITGSWSPSIINTLTPGTSTYTFTIEAGQCALGTSMDIEIIAPTAPAFIQVQPLCINASAPILPTLSDNGINGSWLPAVINTSASGISTYTFTPDPGICANNATMDIEIVALPLIDPGVDQTIDCITNVNGAQLGATPISGNTYSWSPSTSLSNSNSSNPVSTSDATIVYTLTVTNSTGCISSGDVSVTVDNDLPVVAITNNTGTSALTCTLVEINVTATGAVNYLWDNGLGNSNAASIVSPGIYTVTGTTLNGCESSAEIEIIQDNEVDLFVALSESEICSGESVSIVANSIEASGFNWTVTQYSATGATNGTAANTVSGAEIAQTLTVTGTSNGTVDYTIVPTLGSCIGEPQTLTVSVLAPSTPSFNLLGPLCIGSSPPSLTSTSLEGISGVWDPTTVSTTSVGNTNYTFTPFQGQCALNQNMEIIVNAVPVVDFSGDSLVGCAPHTVVLTSNAVGNCQWSIGSGGVYNGNQVSVVLNSAGCYDVTLQVDDGGCTNSLTMLNYICLEEDPVADFSASPDLFTDDDVLVSFTNLSSGASSFIWDFGDNSTSTYINPSNLYESTEEGAFITLTAISDFGCIDIAQMIIEYDEQEVYYIPNTFTPDGDNFNQIFTPMFYSGFDPFNFEMLIFNRWGETVFETHNAAIGWDGTHGVKGTKVSDGTFTWKITYKNPKTDQRKVLVGHVTLIR